MPITTLSVVENDGTFTDVCETPEGAFLLGLIESCFEHAGQKIRRIIRHIECGKTMPGDILEPNSDAFIVAVRKLRKEKDWLYSDKIFPVSFMFICESVAHEPYGFASAIRQEFNKLMVGANVQRDRYSRFGNAAATGFIEFDDTGVLLWVSDGDVRRPVTSLRSADHEPKPACSACSPFQRALCQESELCRGRNRTEGLWKDVGESAKDRRAS